VRAAAGPPIQQSNCHPFRHDNWLFMHNGFLDGFLASKRDLVLAIDPSLFPLIHGTTDTEVLFYLAITLGLQDDPVAGLTRAIRMVESVGRSKGTEFPMQGTVAVSDGHTLWTFRYSSSHRTRSLYHSVDIPALRELYPDAARLQVFGEKAKVVVSEPLTDMPGAFVEVPESTVAILDDDGYHHEPFMEDVLTNA
jgi:predicted glutamine amidotransferase